MNPSRTRNLIGIDLLIFPFEEIEQFAIRQPKSIFFDKYFSRACVCAYFFVPLHPNLYWGSFGKRKHTREKNAKHSISYLHLHVDFMQHNECIRPRSEIGAYHHTGLATRSMDGSSRYSGGNRLVVYAFTYAR